MNKKAITCLTMTTLAFGACALVISHNPEFRTHANGTPFVLELSDISTGSWVDTYYGVDGNWKPFLTATKNHNDVYLRSYDTGFRPSEKKLFGGTSNYFTNLSPINGIKSLTISGDHDFLISYGYAPNRFDVVDVLLHSGETYDFDNNYPSYFKVANNSDEDNYLSSFSLEYSCEEHENPFNDRYLKYYFNNAELDENKGYIVGNSEENPGYLSGNVIIKDKYDDGEHGEWPVISTDDRLFYGSTVKCVESVYFPDSITSYGNYTFESNKGIKSVRLSPNAHNLPSRMFYECEKLQGISFPNGLLTIGDQAFVECNVINTIVIPDSVISLGSSCFQGIDNLKNLTIGSGLSSISPWAFAGTGLESVTIPDNIITINSHAFHWCFSLESVTFGENVQTIGDFSFDGNPALSTLDFSKCEHLTTISASAFREDDALVSVELPDTVVTIGASAFRLCSNLESITFGSHVVTIGDYAFNGCYGLTSIVIPGSASDLWFSAFDTCTNLEEVTFAEGVSSIPNSFLANCYKLATVHFPSTLFEISRYAFENDIGLLSVDLPAGLAKLCNGAFKNCTNLATVNYGGTVDEWNSIAKEDNNWYQGTAVTVVHCSNGDVTL